METVQRLVFVYDAKSGVFSRWIDALKHALSMHSCPLAAITRAREWRNAQSTLKVPIDYVHTDDIPREVADVAGAEYPCILARAANGALQRLVGPAELAECAGSVAALRERLARDAKTHQMELPELLIEA